jgi:hypothetical protein
VLQGVPNNYETDLLFPIVQKAAEIAQVDYFQASPEQKVSLRIIGDHARAVMHLIADGVIPSNVERGYVLRRLIRRMVRHGRLLGIGEPFTLPVVETAIQLAEAAYPEVREREGGDQSRAAAGKRSSSSRPWSGGNGCCLICLQTLQPVARQSRSLGPTPSSSLTPTASRWS